ncbi:hypothetical protein Tco_0053714 [Tanacetum coccineum]
MFVNIRTPSPPLPACTKPYTEPNKPVCKPVEVAQFINVAVKGVKIVWGLTRALTGHRFILISRRRLMGRVVLSLLGKERIHMILIMLLLDDQE